MQLEKLWCQRPFGEPYRTGERFFEIGLAAFAPCAADNDFYFETLWGGLYGEGWLVTLDSQGGVRKKQSLWIA